jgi:hypothetical protein
MTVFRIRHSLTSYRVIVRRTILLTAVPAPSLSAAGADVKLTICVQAAGKNIRTGIVFQAPTGAPRTLLSISRFIFRHGLSFLPIYYRDSRRLVFRAFLAFLAFLVLRIFLLSPLRINPGRRDREARGFLGAPGATTGGPVRGRLYTLLLSVWRGDLILFCPVAFTIFSRRFRFTVRRFSTSSLVRVLFSPIYTV